MHSITLRFLAQQSTLPVMGRVHGGTVLRWVDEAGFACATAWARGACVTALVGSVSLERPIHLGDLVEVQAQLAFTGQTSMNLLVEVRRHPVTGGEPERVTRCVAVYTAVDDTGQPRMVDRWTPETPGDIALAQRVRAHIDAARAAL